MMNIMRSFGKIEKKAFLMLLLAILLLIVGISDHSLWESDEPWDAEISREMSVSGDYLIPMLANKPFLEKPPLYYAVTGLFWRTFGTDNEGAGRIPAVLFAAGTILVVFFGTRALYNERAAAFSSLILATTVQFFMASHSIIIENALTFFITAALVSFMLAYKQKFKQGYMVFWLCVSLAFMAKGIIGIAIPCVSVILFIFWQKDFQAIRKTRLIPGIFLVGIIILTWALVLYLRGGNEYLSTFFIRNNLGRFIGVKSLYVGSHLKPFYFYIPTVFLDSFPWSVLMIGAFIATRTSDERMRFFISWFFGGLLLLSLAATKRHLYFMPMYPAMGVIVGRWLSRINFEGSFRWEKLLIKGVLILIAIISFMAPVAYVKIGGSIPAAVAGFLVFAGVFSLASIYIFKSLPEQLIVCLALFFLTWAPLYFPQMDTLKTCKPFFQEAGKIIGHDKVIGYRLTETVESLCPFYGGFYADVIGEKDTFKQLILSNVAVYVIVLPDNFDKDMQQLLVSKGKKILVINSNRERSGIQLWRI
jgi:4-amino-4-deoxy-L-arabinose transferase-like glycosyltransferase